jgi:hypothetical protein
LGDDDRVLDLLERAFETGFHAANGLEVNPLFRSLRANPRYVVLIDRMREKQSEAERAFGEADGARLLGLPHPSSASFH